MAELAGVAVRSLLGVIRDEAKLLGGVGGDVQFIKEEMESMNSFLLHLARKTPRNGEHDVQVRTWMKQVRDLAHDCSNCIDVYLQRGDPAVYRARGILLGYVWWVPWFIKKTVAQHLAATQLRDLKARARDVGERRLRYGVEGPAKADSDKLVLPEAAAESSPSFQAAAAGIVAEGDYDLEEDYYWATSDDPRREQAFSEPRIVFKCTKELMHWLKHQHMGDPFKAIAIAAPDEEDGRDIINQALLHNSIKEKFDHIFFLNEKMFIFEAATPTAGEKASYTCLQEPWDFLGDILKELEGEADESVEEFGEEEVNEKIGKIEEKIEEYLEKAGNKGYRVEPLGVLCGILRVLLQDATAGEDPNQTEEQILNETADKMKNYLESGGAMDSCRIGVEHSQYIAILQELLPNQATTLAKAATNKLAGEDYIVKNIKDITLKIQVHITPELLPVSLHQQDKSVEESGQDHLSLPWGEEDCRKRIEQVLEKIKEHLLIQETVGRVREYLKDTRTLVILHDASGYKWDETAEALQNLGCSSMAVIVTTKYMQGSKDFCYGTEPIVYSSIEYYHKTALQLTNRRVNDDEKYSAEIFHEILEKCRVDEFSLNMFIHALFANPMRSREELGKLSNSLVFGGSAKTSTNGYKMIKFSYSDLPREYKTCLLYLAIFHEGEKINRTRLIGRWVAEGLITRQDWSSSVSQAEHCLEVLADLWLVCPCDVGAAGKVKSITVHQQVYNFITMMARKVHILDTRLSRHLARHFSILSNIRLRPSDSILDFLKQPSRASSQLKLVKVLDLEGCASLGDNQRWLKNICTSLILLKYLSLRNTDVTQLPKEINMLQQLEVLDIRDTPINASAIKHLMLLKLKRLLAGHTDDASILSTVQMPHKVRKMTDLEVLSHVEASKHHATELREIGQLWQLRVLGVVIYDWKPQLENLLQGISNLNECLKSLSIEIRPPPASQGATPPDVPATNAMSAHCKNTPKLLESLSISGVTKYGRLHPLFTRGCHKLAKVTLHNTFLDQDDMESLAHLPNLRGLRLRHINLHTEGKLIIQTNGFQNLKYLTIEGGGITDINFEQGEVPKLEKIVWLIDVIESLSGINNLPKLKKWCSVVRSGYQIR
ncbi:hypothetical protein CFC21_015586 [Triticum aestivum]|uniref:Rx N-terminal domain-containing protein n=3 Tax=Triticum TaxID=4564 RepID=A0A9R1R3E5_TRITD|nr:hypothetical protein CFC21_015586 [Triticum aestivum]VAH26860.1 unnamed protein product [Triticum turgidum subsp. durum]